MQTMRRVIKATELKRFKELEGKYHYMGETPSGAVIAKKIEKEESGARLKAR